MKPHLKILLEDGTEYLDRWHLIPRNRWFNVYLHRTRADDYRVLHDHPWDNLSIILSGGYYETVCIDKYNPSFYSGKHIYWRKPGTILRRFAEESHSLSLPPIITRDGKIRKQECWSLFITWKVRRNWGFWTKNGWMAHEKLVVIKDGKSQMTKEGLEYLV